MFHFNFIEFKTISLSKTLNHLQWVPIGKELNHYYETAYLNETCPNLLVLIFDENSFLA